MFTQLKNIDTAFKHVKLFTFVLIGACMAICCFAIFESYRMVSASQSRIYLLANGKALEALSSERKDNVAVEARDQVRMFHYYFFTLDPDDKVIEDHLSQALYLADGSAKKQYDDLKEGGFYAEVISGNVSQQMQMDSIQLDLKSYPYYFKYYGTEKLIRPTVVVTRSMITEGYLRNVSRSDNNAHGFLIERWRILENKDLDTKKAINDVVFKKRKPGLLAPVREVLSVSIAKSTAKLQYHAAAQLTKWEKRLNVQQKKCLAVVFLLAGVTWCSCLLVRGIWGDQSYAHDNMQGVAKSSSVVQPPALRRAQDSLTGNSRTRGHGPP